MIIGSLGVVCLDEASKVPEALIKNAMRHLVLAHISPSNTARNHWKGEARAFINQIRKKVGGKKPKTNIVNEINANWDLYYRDAIKDLYRKEEFEQNNPIHYEDIPRLPMWEFEDFMKEDIEILVPMTKLGSLLRGGGSYYVNR